MQRRSESCPFLRQTIPLAKSGLDLWNCPTYRANVEGLLAHRCRLGRCRFTRGREQKPAGFNPIKLGATKKQARHMGTRTRKKEMLLYGCQRPLKEPCSDLEGSPLNSSRASASVSCWSCRSKSS